MSCSTLKRRRRHGRRRADNGSVLANLPATVISFHAKRTWIIQPWMCPGIIFHGRKQTVTVSISVLLRHPHPLLPSLPSSTLRSSAVRFSLSLSLSLVLSRACHKLRGQTGATGPRIYQYPIRACTFPPCLVLSRSATFLVYALSSPAPRTRPQVNRHPSVFGLQCARVAHWSPSIRINGHSWRTSRDETCRQAVRIIHCWIASSSFARWHVRNECPSLLQFLRVLRLLTADRRTYRKKENEFERTRPRFQSRSWRMAWKRTSTFTTRRVVPVLRE